MAGRLKALRLEQDPVLSNVAFGYRTGQLAFEALFPIVPTTKEGATIPKWGPEHFGVSDVKRSVRSKYARGTVSPGKVTIALQERGFEELIDLREVDEAEELLMLEQVRTRLAMFKVMQDLEADAATLAQTAANYHTDLRDTDGPTVKWSTAANSTPIQDVKMWREAVADFTGMLPNVGVFGVSVFNVLTEHAQITEKIKYTQKGIVTEELLASVLGLDRVVVGRSYYYNPATGKMKLNWDAKTVVLGVVPPASMQSEATPAYGYTFRRTGYPKVETYAEESANSEVIRAKDLSQPYHLSNHAGFLAQAVVA